VSIGAFEHFGFNKYDDYFKKTYDWLPDDGVQMLHTIIIPEDEEIKAKGLPLTMSRVRFIKFIMDYIYPGGRLPLASMVKEHAVNAGYTVTREQHLQPHYVKTLDAWANNLKDKKDEAIAISGEEIYERFVKYLEGCADLFREGYTDVAQFTLEKAPA
jgi:cyclopropane-fatty-acyl-phospholipid synthase